MSLPKNQLLAALPPDVAARLQTRTEAVELAPGTLLSQAGTPLRQVLRYTQVLFTHMAQTSACHRHHALAPQLCRWLLQHLDRQAGDKMRITQERIACMLGVRREGITGAALELQRNGLIQYSRGHIPVLDRRGLELHSCECYGVVNRAYAQLRSGGMQPPPWPAAPAWAPAAAGLPAPRAPVCAPWPATG